MSHPTPPAAPSPPLLHTLAAGSVLLAAGIWIGRALAVGAPAESPLTYGGVVSDAAGKAPTAPVAVVVAFYDAANGGNAVCQSATAQAAAGSGRFSVALPKACADAVHANSTLWSEVVVGPSKVALPRQKVGAVPYALQAQGAAVAHDVECAGCVEVGALKFDKDVDLGGKKLTAGTLDLGPTAGDELASAQVKTLTGGGNADALHTHAGSGGGGGVVWKYKGLTAQTFKGDAGLGAINGACAQQYGAARMCGLSMLDAMAPDPVPSAEAWVLFDPGAAIPVGNLTFSSRGIQFTVNTSNSRASNCAQLGSPFFTLGGNYPHGLIMKPDGNAADADCNVARPAMCCGY